MGTIFNNEGPDKIPQNSTFHQRVLCLLRKRQSSETEDHLNLEILTFDPFYCTMNYPIIVTKKAEESMGKERVRSPLKLVPLLIY